MGIKINLINNLQTICKASEKRLRSVECSNNAFVEEPPPNKKDPEI